MKAAIHLFCTVLLSGLSCLAQTRPGPSDSTKTSMQLTSVYSEILPSLHRTTSVPLRLPARVSGLGAEDEVHAVLKSANATGYVIVLGATPDCAGQHVCSYGTVIGTSRSLDASDEYSMSNRRGSTASLHHGIKARLYQPICGSYCSDSLVVWAEGKCHYIIGLKAGSKRALILAANSAIDADF